MVAPSVEIVEHSLPADCSYSMAKPRGSRTGAGCFRTMYFRNFWRSHRRTTSGYAVVRLGRDGFRGRYQWSASSCSTGRKNAAGSVSSFAATDWIEFAPSSLALRRARSTSRSTTNGVRPPLDAIPKQAWNRISAAEVGRRRTEYLVAQPFGQRPCIGYAATGQHKKELSLSHLANSVVAAQQRCDSRQYSLATRSRRPALPAQYSRRPRRTIPTLISASGIFMRCARSVSRKSADTISSRPRTMSHLNTQCIGRD